MSLGEYYLWTYGIGIGVLMLLNALEMIQISRERRSNRCTDIPR